MEEVEHRRRRTRGRAGTDGTRTAVPQRPAASVTPSDIADRAGSAADHQPPERPLPFDAHTPHPAHDEREGERGLRGLVGGGSTQVSVAAAMRARDAARPTAEELAAAAASLTIVHRGWVPRDNG
ncbi:MAG TPA: hypothetical protein VGJ28_05190 [Micromonosporaceae bacterium]|jgi:hypothetical protein